MTRCIFFIIALFYCCLCCNAQEVTSVTIKAGTSPTEVMHDSDIYHKPQFVSGQVFLKDGTVATARLNYNRVLDEIQFIDPKGDTLALANEQGIRFIVLGADSFYFAGSFVRKLRSGIRAHLGIKQFWQVADSRKQSGYNTTSSVAASVSESYYTSGTRMHRLAMSGELVLKKAELYFIGDRTNRFLAASKKNLISLFPKAEKQITAFVNTHKIDFRKLADLEKTFSFLETME